MLLSELGHEVHVLAFGDLDSDHIKNKQYSYYVHQVPFKTNSKIMNAIYYSFPSRLIRQCIKKLLPSVLFIMEWNFFAFIYFKELNATKKFDVLHTPVFHAPALLIKVIYGKKMPLIAHEQGSQQFLNPYQKKTIDSSIQAIIESYYLRRYSKKIICCSNYIMNKVKKAYQSIAHRCIEIPNFVVREILINKSSLNKKNIVFMGRLEFRKGVDMLLDAFVSLAKQDKDIKLFLIGDNGWGFGANKNKSFRQLFNGLKIPDHIKSRIYFFPRIDDRKSQLHLLYNLKGLGVFPSRHEPFGLVTIEAMAMGYITIVGENGGGSEIISDGIDGYLVSDAAEIKKTILNVQKMSIMEIQSIASNAIERVTKHYHVKVVRKRYKKLYSGDMFS